MLVGYARVSTDLQTTDGQIGALNTAGCERVFQESISGTRADRPELAAALAFARRLPIGTISIAWFAASNARTRLWDRMRSTRKVTECTWLTRASPAGGRTTRSRAAMLISEALRVGRPFSATLADGLPWG
jgi:Resolvase, N terminal domain